MDGLFVSYRRSDSQGEAGRLFDDLVKHFGEHTVFMDVAAIEAGRDFRKAIEEGVTKCGVLLVVIGLEWLDAKDERGARRLADPADFVRIETAAALKRDIPVVPVLVRGAKMPSAEQLPEELKELAYRNCIELTHARWKSDIQLLIEALRRLLGGTTQAGTSAKASGATAVAQPSAPQQGTASSKLAEESSARFDPAARQRITRELALRIGPIAGIVVSRATSQCNSLEELYLKVAEEIEAPEEREQFLREGAASPSTPLTRIAEAARSANQMSEVSGLPRRSEGNDVPSKPAGPATNVQSSNRRKYLLLASAGGLFLTVMLVVAIRFASSRGAGSSQTAQTSHQVTHTTEAAPLKSGTPPPVETPATRDKPVQSPTMHATDQSEHPFTKRVVVPAKVAKSILISTAVPIYPLLARQAHIQGLVVLDADISKNGAVEALKVISGHPLLVPAALETAKQWRYKPYVLNGEPVAINTQIMMDFTLK